MVALFMVSGHYAGTYQLQSIGLVLLTPMALLIGFSGLMYNRARATDSRLPRFRSLYAAERLMTASCYYVLALVLAFIITVFLQPLDATKQLPPENTLMLVYSPAMLFCIFAFNELMFALFAITPVPLFRHPRRVAFLVRRL